MTAWGNEKKNKIKHIKVKQYTSFLVMSCKNIEYQYSKSLARRQKRRAEASLVFVFIFLSMYVFNVLVGFFKRGWFIADVFAIVSFFPTRVIGLITCIYTY